MPIIEWKPTSGALQLAIVSPAATLDDHTLGESYLNALRLVGEAYDDFYKEILRAGVPRVVNQDKIDAWNKRMEDVFHRVERAGRAFSDLIGNPIGPLALLPYDEANFPEATGRLRQLIGLQGGHLFVNQIGVPALDAFVRHHGDRPSPIYNSIPDEKSTPKPPQNIVDSLVIALADANALLDFLRFSP